MFQYCVTVSKDSSASGYQTERCFSNMSAYSRISGDRQRIQFSVLFHAIFEEKVPSNKKSAFSDDYSDCGSVRKQ